MRNYIIACLATLAAAPITNAPITHASEIAEAPRPNVLLILADDLGWADLGCYGHPFHETPNLDRLAADGMRFTQAYAASCVCSPTRSSIMTGKYPARNDLTIWLGGHGGAPAVDHMALDEVTIAEAMKEQGYSTAHIGKWHLGGEPYLPQHQGFDVNIAGTHAGSPAGGYFLPNKMELDDMQPGEYLTDRLTDECLKVLDQWHERPFFIYLPYHTVHTPIQGRADLVDYYRKKLKPGEDFNPAYAAMVHCLDQNVGRLMSKLEDLQLAENTLVIFFSDNGGYAYSGGRKNNVTSNLPLRRGKGYCYEGGHREPMIVRYPPIVPQGTTCAAPVISTDFYPTILDLIGARAKPEQHVDGMSIVSLLQNPAVSLPRDTLYWHYPHNSPQGGKPSGAIREGDWKLIEWFGDEHIELYNLAEDLGEQHDLSQDMPEKAADLRDKLAAWRTSVDAKLPSDAPSTAAPVAVKEVQVTNSYPGFDVITDAGLQKSALGLDLASTATGLALTKADRPLSGQIQFALHMRPLAGHPSNGFLAFGDKANDKELVKCGLLVGGSNICIYEGEYPPSVKDSTAMQLAGGQVYDVVVTVDLDQQTATMQVGEHSVSHRFQCPLPRISYFGYAAIRTKTSFSPITISQE